MKCYHCDYPLPEGKLRCVNHRCRMWNIAQTVSLEDSTVLLSDAKLGTVEYVPTGLVDLAFGGEAQDGEIRGRGIARTSVTLIGGEPGAGKTTLCMQLSDFFAGRYAKEVLYIANEQDATELKATGERLDLQHKNRIRIVKAMGGVTHDIGALLMHYKPCAIILDSVTKWSGENMNEAVVICQRLKDYTVRLNAPSFVINQLTKSGDHSGLNKMQHAVDTTMLFEVWGERPDGPRRLHVRKNRFGLAPISQHFEMTPKGLSRITEEEALERLTEEEEERVLARLRGDNVDEEVEEEEEEEEEND